MKKRDWIYVALLAFIAFGFLVDAAVWPHGAPNSLTANDLVQLVGLILLVSSWQIADAHALARRRNGAVQLLTVFFIPLGQIIYIYQSRPWKQATVLCIGFFAGVLAAAAMAAYLGIWLVETGVFPPGFIAS